MRASAAYCTIMLVAARETLGCPVCDTETGAVVRAGIFNASFVPTFLEVISPFLALAVVLYAINRHLPE